MSDIFREIEDDLHQEKLIHVWRKYQNWLFGAVAAILIGVGTWKYYDYNQNLMAEQASEAYEAALERASQVNPQDRAQQAEIYEAFHKLAQTAPAGYALLARFQAAAQLAQYDAPASIKMYEEIAQNSDNGILFQDLAQLRAGLMRLEQADDTEIQGRLELLTQPSRPFRHSARELLAFFALRHNKLQEAARQFDQISRDGDASASLRQRAETMLDLIKSMQ